jgi:hypothetical protein
MTYELLRLRHLVHAAVGLVVACSPKGDDETSTTDPVDTADTTEGTDSATSSPSPTSSTGPAPSNACDDPQPILQTGTDQPSGFVRCASGRIHRVEAVTCVQPTPTATCEECLDCDAPMSACVTSDIGGCFCAQGCASDADCAEDQICRCAGDDLGLYATCVSASCTTTAACDGELCAASTAACAVGISSVSCTTPQDKCVSSDDCPEFFACVDWSLDEPPAWQCEDLSTCGRPYHVDGASVVADPAPRADWLAPAPPCAVAPADLRPEVAARWTRLALQEHASIASFAGFVLQLLAVGAPAELVALAQRALADEVEHARLAFAVAARHGAAVGPGPLPVGAPAAADLDAAVAATIHEGCVGETLSALAVRRAAALAQPGLRDMLSKIAADEEEHAALAWRFVRWALERGADRSLAAAAFAAAVAAADADAARMAAAPAAPALRRFGLLDGPAQADVWRRGLAELVAPCAAALAA